MVVDQRVGLGFSNSEKSNALDDPIDQTVEFSVKTALPPPPPYWLILPIGIAIYLATRR